MSQQWKERTAEIFQRYDQQQQQLQYEERLQRLAKKLETTTHPQPNMHQFREQENHRDELEQRLNDLNERLNTLSYKLDRELQNIGQQTTSVEEYLEKAKLLNRNDLHVSCESNELQQCQQRYMLLFEKEIDERRNSETQLVGTIEGSVGDLSLELMKESEKRECSVNLLQNSKACGQLVAIRELIEQLTRNRTECQEQQITHLAQQCRNAEERIGDLSTEQSAFEEESFDMLKEVASKVAQELQMEALDRKRTEQQILMLIEAMCDRLGPCR